MRARLVPPCVVLALVSGLVSITGCSSDDDPLVPPGGGGADIDVASSTPPSGNTNISGSSVSVSTDTFVGNGTGGFDNGVDYTRVTVDANTDGHVRRILVYFETDTGIDKAVSYFWGVTDRNDNIVYCPAAGCAGVTVNTGLREISFLNTALDNHPPLGPTTKFATLSLGGIEYP